MVPRCSTSPVPVSEGPGGSRLGRREASTTAWAPLGPRALGRVERSSLPHRSSILPNRAASFPHAFSCVPPVKSWFDLFHRTDFTVPSRHPLALHSLPSLTWGLARGCLPFLVWGAPPLGHLPCETRKQTLHTNWPHFLTPVFALEPCLLVVWSRVSPCCVARWEAVKGKLFSRCETI